MIYFLSALHGIILAILVAFHKKFGKPTSNRLLGLTILFFALCLAEYGLYTSGYFLQMPHAIASTNLFLFSIPPLIYVYVKSRVNEKVVAMDLFGFVPVVIYLFAGLPFYLLKASEKLNVTSTSTADYFIFSEFWIFFYLALCIFFSYLSLNVISSHLHIGSRGYSELVWIRRIIIAFIVFSCLDVGLFLVGARIDQFKIIAQHSTTILHAVLIHLLGYIAILNPKILFELRPGKYQRSTLSASASKHLLDKILKYMESEKPYMDSELRMTHLADKLSLTTNQLSQILNQELNKNFNEFINEYRVKEVQQRLMDPSSHSYTIHGIAMVSGFNSKNAFNRTFKRLTGQTPSEYLNSQKAKENF